MKKIPLFIKIAFPLLVVAIGAGVYFGIMLHDVNQQCLQTEARLEDIRSIPEAIIQTDYSYEKSEFQSQELDTSEEKDRGLAQYTFNHIKFISYSKQWDENKLKLLCEELLKNKHGSEIDYLDSVFVYGQKDDAALGIHNGADRNIEVPVVLFDVFPNNFTYKLANAVSVITLYNADNYTTVEQMAITLSHEYGHHFTLYYFNLKGDAAAIEQDPYFNLRYVDDIGIRYHDEDRDDWNEYLNNHMWYLIEIAAEDYVYLMGSPNTRRQIEYLDSMDTLKLNAKKKDDELESYYAIVNESSFNESPHENIALLLPDQVDGLAELYYSMIDLDAPEYTGRSEQAEDINIKISARRKHEKLYYNITWDKPWKSEDVTYTLVAYDENDSLIGAIKSVSGDEKALASIGSVVYETQNYYHYYDYDFWVKHDKLRFRVVVTFPDGTAVVSPPVDRSF